LRRVAVAALAVPVIALTYLPILLRRSIVARGILVVGIAAVVGLGASGFTRPTATVATAPGQPVPLTSAAFTTDLRAGQEPDAAVTIAFSTPMDPGSVRAHLSVDPPVSVALSWDEAGTTLTVAPTGAWNTARFHTITVAAGALALTGRPLSSPIRAAFLTRAATAATISPTRVSGDEITADTAFDIVFDRPIDPASLHSGLLSQPAIEGTLERVGRRTGEHWRLTPTVPLALDTTYTLGLSTAVRDIDGAGLAGPATVSVRTAAPPHVVRFRPADRSTGVAWDQVLSVRFTESMDPTTTGAAFSVTAGGTAVKGTVRFAENQTVLVFDPAATFGYGQQVVMVVSADAQSVAGIALGAEIKGSFTTAARPAPRTVSIPTGGGSIGTSSWAAVEVYYTNLMNCTRTGGWVTSGGDCSSPGGRNVAPLVLDAGMTANVARPYARLLAEGNLCSHFIGGNPGDRLRAAGYTGFNWAENIGCRSGDPYTSVLATHLFYQSEQSYNGGHYVNLMNAAFTRVGVGVWVSGGRVRLVVDFIGP
jgi:uncharacterized protein YkwD